MGWTFQEYEAQPIWFVQTAILYLRAEVKKQKNG
jgi:hypothetical protein